MVAFAVGVVDHGISTQSSAQRRRRLLGWGARFYLACGGPLFIRCPASTPPALGPGRSARGRFLARPDHAFAEQTVTQPDAGRSARHQVDSHLPCARRPSENISVASRRQPVCSSWRRRSTDRNSRRSNARHPPLCGCAWRRRARCPRGSARAAPRRGRSSRRRPHPRPQGVRLDDHLCVVGSQPTLITLAWNCSNTSSRSSLSTSLMRVLVGVCKGLASETRSGRSKGNGNDMGCEASTTPPLAPPDPWCID